MSRLGFSLEATAPGSRARAGRFRTLHNEVLTPLFMPVGTNATVRAQRFETLEETGSQILLANTFHLLLRPGPKVFERFGGIHRFMGWERSVLTDSGGYQIFSLTRGCKLSEEGAVFRSYIDGRQVALSPEASIGMQRAIGSDIMMVLDQCIPSTSEQAVAREAMERTHRWAKRSLAARGDSPQSLFGIVQGACFEELRRESARAIASLPFDGYAIGGLAVGEEKARREDITELTASLLPEGFPRYLMGVGTPIDLLEAVHRGVDMFDCILPTALAQQGVAFTSHGRVDLRRGAYRLSDDSLDRDCSCPSCAKYSRAYLHHLIKAREVLGWQLIGAHNLEFYHRLMREMRESILASRFAEYYAARRGPLARDDEETPKTPPRRNTRSERKLRLRIGDYELHRAPEGGHFSIRQRSSGEVMHSVSEPRKEARRLYVEQSRLAERLAVEGPELVVWDVGLGAGTNAMETIFAAERSARRPLRIVSFESDLDSFRLALRFHELFPHLWHQAPSRLLEKGEWVSSDGLLRWNLVEGDFLATLGTAEPADLVFYDPFSFKADSPLWTPDCFARLAERVADRRCELFTYTASTRARAALLSAGFFVARGVPTGPKAETTIALNFAGERELLNRGWLERWERSEARIPAGLPEEGRAEFERRVREHRQWDSEPVVGRVQACRET